MDAVAFVVVVDRVGGDVDVSLGEVGDCFEHALDVAPFEC